MKKSDTKATTSAKIPAPASRAKAAAPATPKRAATKAAAPAKSARSAKPVAPAAVPNATVDVVHAAVAAEPAQESAVAPVTVADAPSPVIADAPVAAPTAAAAAPAAPTVEPTAAVAPTTIRQVTVTVIPSEVPENTRPPREPSDDPHPELGAEEWYQREKARRTKPLTNDLMAEARELLLQAVAEAGPRRGRPVRVGAAAKPKPKARAADDFDLDEYRPGEKKTT